MKNTFLDIAEYVTLAGSVIGTALAVIYQQIALAAAPVSAALLFNLANRRRLEEYTPTVNGEPVLINPLISNEVESLRSSVRQLPTQQDLQTIRSALQSDLQRLETRTPPQDYNNLLQTIAALNSRLDGTADSTTVQQLDSNLARTSEGLAQLQRELTQLQTALNGQPNGTYGPISSAVSDSVMNLQLEQLRNALQHLQESSESNVSKQDFLSLVEATKVLEKTITPVTAVVSQLRNQVEEINQEINSPSSETITTIASEQLEEIRNALEQINRRVDLEIANLAGMGTPGGLSSAFDYSFFDNQFQEINQTLTEITARDKDTVTRAEFISLAEATNKYLQEYAEKVNEINTSNGSNTQTSFNPEYFDSHIQEFSQTLAELEARSQNSVTRAEFISLAEATHKLLNQYAEKILEVPVVTIPNNETSNPLVTPLPPGQNLNPDYVDNYLQEFHQTLSQIEDRTQSFVTRPEFISLAEASHQLLEEYRNKVEQLEAQIMAISLGEIATSHPLENHVQELNENLNVIQERATNSVTRQEFISLAEATQQKLNENVMPLSLALAEIRGQIDTLTQQVSQRDAVDLTSVHEVLANIAQRVNEATAFGEKVSGVVEAVEIVNTELESIKNNLNRHDQLLPATMEQIEALRFKVGELNRRIDEFPIAVNPDMNAVEDVLAKIAASVAEVKTQTEDRLTHFQSEILLQQSSAPDTNNTEKIAELETSFATLQRSIQTLADKAEIELIVNQKVDTEFGQINQILQAILSEDVQLIFDRPNIRTVLESALTSAQNRIILVSPWLSQTGLDTALFNQMEAFLQRQGKIDLGWGHLQDIEVGEFPRRLNQEWQIPDNNNTLYNALNQIQQLQDKYPNQLQLKILGTHENYIVQDNLVATITTHNFLASDVNFPEREVAVKTKDPRIIQGLIDRYNEPVLKQSNADIYRKRGLERLYIHDYQGAISDYTQALELEPNNPNAYNARGLIYFNSGDTVAAVKDYTYALQLDPNEPAYYFNRGFASLKIGQYENSIQDFSQALHFIPKDADTYFQLAEAYRHSGEYEKAAANYTQALEINPQDAVFFNNRGLVHYELGNFAQAIEDYSHALEINPQDAVTYFNRAMAACAIDKEQEAMSDFNGALELNPHYAAAYYYRGFVWIEMGDRPAARADFRQAAELFAAQGDSEHQKKSLDIIHTLG